MALRSALAQVLKVGETALPPVIARVCIDSRCVQPDDLFVAFKGEHVDGHQFLSEVALKGAAAALVEQVDSEVNLKQWPVTDTRLALGQLAKFHRQQFTCPVIGITGSNGKTSVKEMTASILRQSGEVLATAGNFNNDIGLPLTVLQLQPCHQFAVIEAGMNHEGEIAYLADIARPDIALVTNIAPAHIGYFQNEAAIAAEKGQLYRALSSDGCAVFLIDSPYYEKWRQDCAAKKCITVSRLQAADITATHVECLTDGSHFTLQSPLGSAQVSLPLLGEHQVTNALLAVAACIAAGIQDLTTVVRGLAAVKPVKGRLAARQGLSGSLILDDSYNANPASMQAALRHLARFKGQRFYIVGDMGELGSGAEQYHRELGDYAKSLGIESVFATGILTKHLCEAFGRGAKHFSEKSALIDAVKSELSSSVVCLVKGSLSAGMQEVVDALLIKD